MADGALLIVGGYGLVGEQAARTLRSRHPGLPLVLAGRTPSSGAALAAELGATTVAIDVRAEEPLAHLGERPAAILAVVSDPHDHLLVEAMRRGIPYADVNRAGPAGILDVTVAAARARPSAPVLLSGSWLAGLSALLAAACARELGPVERIDLTALSSSDDRVGPDSWGFSERLAWPYYAMRDGRRTPTHPMTTLLDVRCADGVERPAALIGTLEQTTLPVTLDVPTVETRMALMSPASLYAMVGLKRAGALRGLARPALKGLREALFQRPGTGDYTGLTVTARGTGRTVSIDVFDTRGQAHLSALGAVAAAERVLGGGLPAGISFPEQHADPGADLDLLRQAGVIVRTNGFPDQLRSTREEVLVP
jgi:saccharopine dehydrogenase-like NADP-dependent oxidoreductase